MTTVSIFGQNLIIIMHGFDMIWSLRKQFVIPLSHISACTPAQQEAKEWLIGIKFGGTHIPGVISAGTFITKKGLTFWDVHHSQNAIAIDLIHEKYKRLIIEVTNPKEIISLIQEQMNFYGN